MIGCFVIASTFLGVKSIRKYPTTLIFWLAVSDFFFSSKFLITSSLQNSKRVQVKLIYDLLSGSMMEVGVHFKQC